MNLAIARRSIYKQAQMLFNLVGIPFACIFLLTIVLLYVIGGMDLLQFTFGRLFTWSGIRRVLIVVGGVTLFTLVRQLAWYRDEPPPMWLRRSGWVNVLEALALLLVIVAGVWALLRFSIVPIQR